MNNEKIIEVNGVKVPVGSVKHWRLAPERVVPMRGEEETSRWMALEALRRGWDALDAGEILGMLDDNFEYGSYWVRDSMDLAAYREYLPKKFDSIRESGSRPATSIVVLYESLTPGEFPYAIRLKQGDVTTLLTLRFNGVMISGLYMTDPDIYTYEPTFRKGGILSVDGEPRCFRHHCQETDIGREMTFVELQSFVVECVARLFVEADAVVKSIHKSEYKEFPNIVTKSGHDVFYHRIDISGFHGDTAVINEEVDEYVAAAKQNDAWPMVMPVSFMCIEGNGSKAVCGGSFFLKVLESRDFE